MTVTRAQRWGNLSPTARVVAGIVGLVIALDLALAGINYITGGSGPVGPTSSSYATSPEGLAAYAALLDGAGHPVERLRVRLDEAQLDPNTTVVVLDPSALLTEEQAALGDFLGQGGRLIGGGTQPLWLEGVLDDPPTWGPGGVAAAKPLVPVAETDGVGTVASAGEGAWADPQASLPILGALGDAGAGALASVVSEGPGRAVLIADPSPLQNRALGRADNAAFGLAVAGPTERPVLFAEAGHGYGEEQGLAALPPRWRFALGGVGVAALLWLVARGRRLGPPTDAVRPLPPARSAYAEAQGASLARARAPGKALTPVVAAARARLAAGAGLGPGAGDDTLAEAARRHGLEPVEIEAILGGVKGDQGAVAAGSALAKLSGKGRRSPGAAPGPAAVHERAGAEDPMDPQKQTATP